MISYHHTLMGLFSLSFSLFLLMDPIGNVPMYILYLRDMDKKKQRAIILRELLISLVTILFFAYIGELILKLLNISQPTLSISGGIILFMIALKMIFPNEDAALPQKVKKEPFIVPLAIPFVAGPSVLAAVMIYSKHTTSHWILLVAIILAWLGTSLVLLSAPTLQKKLGEKGLSACERLMGLILTLISVQMFLEGVSLFLKQNPTT